jgi:hypothetical protein
MRRTILWAGSARIITVGFAVIVALMLWMAVTTTPATKASAQESSTTLSTLWVVARADGSVVRSSGLTGLLRTSPGKYEVLFRRDVSGCAYTATVGDPGNQRVNNRGLVFTAGGHQSNAGVYVETKNLAGGLADYPFHLAVDCSKPPLDAERVSLLHLNLAGLYTYGGVPWRDRHRRLASWMGRTQIIPDLLVLQEAPASKCSFFEGCNPKDYEALFRLITAIEVETGIRYRVALLSTGPAVNEGLYDLYQGGAVLYNPDRLRNTMRPPTSASIQPYGSPVSRTVERRESYPCRDPLGSDLWRCSLVDRQSSTWGYHWAVHGAAFARFVLAEPAQVPAVTAALDVYDVHAPFNPNAGGTADLEPTGDAVRRIEQVNPPAAGTRMFPPILAGDFNATEDWMKQNMTEPGQPLEEFEIAAYAPQGVEVIGKPPGGDVIGILVGDGRFPSRYRAKAVDVRFLPERGPGLCGEPAARWSDHCGQYAELIPIAR